MLGILNKLTPQKFAKLIGQIQELEVNTETRLTGIIDLIFEKAIDEPNFSVPYALLCKTLSSLVVQPEGNIPGAKPITFRVKLLARCQAEFEKDEANEIELGKLEAEIHAEDDEKKKKMLELKVEEAQANSKRRSTGNIRFIGELFKLKMLTEKIMHQCLTKLLQQKDEKSLECLCCLFTTIGKGIDQNTGEAKTQMDSYFTRMQTIVDEKLTSARIRFLVMDVIDLRQNNWVPRRTTNDPKTIDQIHKDAAAEKEREAMMAAQDNHMLPIMLRVGGGGQRSGPMGGQRVDDGWTTVSTKPVDMSGMKLTKQDDFRPGQNWGPGSTGDTKQPEVEPKPSVMGNRFSALTNDNRGRGAGRGLPPTPGRPSTERSGRPQQTMPRRQTGGRGSQESDRESALAAVRSISGTQQQHQQHYVRGSDSRGNSRDNSRSRDGSANREFQRPSDITPRPRESSLTRAEPATTMPKMGKMLTASETENKAKAILEEYLLRDDKKEILSVTSSPMKQRVGLHTAETSWFVHMRTKKQLYIEKPHDVELATERLLCKMRSILNKITPQKFFKLIRQTQELNINSEKALTTIVDLIVDKAMAEPNFYLPCALLCKTLSGVVVDSDDPDDEPVTFEEVLDERFETDVDENMAIGLEVNQLLWQIEDEDDAKKRKVLELELEELKAKSRRRKIYKCRLIGELYKLNMMTNREMHQSAVAFFKRNDEESLECLCIHLTVIGANIDGDDIMIIQSRCPNTKETKEMTLMDTYINHIQSIIDEKSTSARIRFMLMDVIDLRQNNWVPRRPSNDDEIIALIHKEAAEKELDALLEVLTYRSLYNRSEQDLIEHRRFWLNLRLPRYSRRTPLKDRQTIDQIQKQAADEKERKATMMAAQDKHKGWSRGLLVSDMRFLIMPWIAIFRKRTKISMMTTEQLFRKVRGILNKLMPQNFAELMEQVKDLEINTETRLTGVIDLIFEKAIDEPDFNVPYALLCQTLSRLAVQPEGNVPGAKPISFRVELLARCQAEFEKDKANEIELGKREAEIHAEDDEKKKKMLELELEEVQFKSKRRSTGNIRFIGELFKQKIMSEKIMHQCLTKLLQQKDEESLECLCVLLKAIGKGIDQNTDGKTQVDTYFTRMQTIIDEKLTSARIRFMLMDVIDLRQNNWVSRSRNDHKPIDQIHEDSDEDGDVTIPADM